MILLGRLLMALVLVVVIGATWQRPPLNEKQALFAQIHSEYLRDKSQCDGRGATQYQLCRELAYETFMTKARHLK